MTTKKQIRSRYQWLAELSSKSEAIRNLCVKDDVSDIVYKTKNNSAVNADAFNFSNSLDHNNVVIDTIENLATKGTPSVTLKKFIIDLTSQITYGTFAELSAYHFLLKGKHQFDIQVPMDGSSILNSNGSDLDGFLQLPEKLFFDVKGFGFLDHLVKRLTDRLSENLTPDIVVAQNSWDVSMELLTDLLGKDYTTLHKELQQKGKATRDKIEFSMRAKQRIQITERVINPELAARENRNYIFRFAKQFTRCEPFFLIFVIHPWFSGQLHINFVDSLDTFTKEFATQAFCTFESDTQLLFGITRADVARLLSGIIFVDAWEGTTSTKEPRYRLFLNPNATNKPKPESVAAFAAPYNGDITTIKVAC